jgi:hypothetical protein
MTQQPEALRLADWLFDHVGHINHAEAAAELRRLDWDNRELRRCAEVQEVEKYASANRRLAKINAQLLEALRFIADRQDLMFAECSDAEEIIEVARAAIAAAKGGA